MRIFKVLCNITTRIVGAGIYAKPPALTVRVFTFMFWIPDRSLYKIFLALKERHKKYWVVWISRHEWDRFWLSEMKLRQFIEILRRDWKLLDFKVNDNRVKCMKTKYTCNVYKLSREFIEFLEKVREFVKKEIVQYTADDVLEYVKTFAKRKYKQWKFTINGINYVVNERWRYRWKILDTQNQKIISLIALQNIYS